ncbi:hypothetical protein IE81DRAFT_10662 [Ceraceosorus guamensis]|uniref:Uncharacterized protein n=1 Tax=Ceraceosorus guamensis TaxID=1522189 RepID=A0A316W499_9BASI|nr:hypothetical protein IE81DRAFT_10662 [Ceraceosorus guamensis]PWN44559.1 hypothetical protein IE81DRAFT_10662 [Ceraceosorus guamensis]
MSLISDKEYVIHTLRLAYLRRIDDSVGPRVITFPAIRHDVGSSGHANGREHASARMGDFDDALDAEGNGQLDDFDHHPDSHVMIAGLSDANFNPELRAVCSPKPRPESLIRPGFMPVPPAEMVETASKGPRASRVGNGLRYTQTIYGPGRTGALGMRVSGKRAPSLDNSTSALASDLREDRTTRSRRRSSVLDRGAEDEAEEPLRAALARRSSLKPKTDQKPRSLEVPELALQAASVESGRSGLLRGEISTDPPAASDPRLSNPWRDSQSSSEDRSYSHSYSSAGVPLPNVGATGRSDSGLNTRNLERSTSVIDRQRR